jgi:PAS domain S-box-containing protein
MLSILRMPLSRTLRNLRRPLWRTALIVAAYLCAFILLDIITQQYEEIRGVVAWYPPAGLTYALLLVFGFNFLPAVTMALLFSSLFIYRMPQPAYLLFLWAVIISLIYGGAAVFLTKRIRFDWHLRKFRDVAWLAVAAIVVSAILAVLSVLSSALSSDMPRSEVLRAMFDWWIGETVGVLTVTPFLLLFVMPGLKRFAEGPPVRLPRRRSFPRPTLSLVGQVASIVFVLYWVFGERVPDEFHPMFLISLPLIWIALQRGLKGISVAILVLNSGVVLALGLFRFDFAHMGDLEVLMIVNGIVGLFMGAVVTERKRVEEALRDSEDKFKYFFDNSIVAHSITSPTGEAEMNGAFCRMLGYSPKELLKKRWQDISHPEDIVSTQKEVDALVSGQESEARFTKRYLHKNGSVVWADVSTSLRRDGQGKPLHFMTTAIDITARRRTEESLRESEEQHRLLVETLPDGVIVHSQGRVVFANPASARIIGAVRPADLIGKPVIEFVHPGHRELALRRIQQSLRDGIPAPTAEEKFVRLDGTPIDVEVSAHPFLYAGTPAMLTVFNDITERRRAENDLRSAKTFLDRIINAIADPVFVKNDKRQFVLVNDALCATVGRARAELLGEDGDDMFPPDQVAVFREMDARVLETGEENVNEESLSNLSSGEVRTIITRKTRYIDPAGHAFLVGVIRDISARKQAEVAMRALSTRQEATLAAVPDILTEVDKNKVYTWANPAGLAFFGEDVIGKEAAYYFEGEQDTYDQVGPLFAGSENVIYVESWQRRKDGEKRLLAWQCRVLKDAEGNVTGALSSAHDITERKRAESQLREQIEELQRWHDATLDRETRILDLKREVNGLQEQTGQTPRYPSAGRRDEKEK